MTKVKICGVTAVPHALVAAEAGADYVGMIFSEPSPRRISPERGAEIRAGLREHFGSGGGRPLLVGVFVNESPDIINRSAESCGLDLVQLSGDEDPSISRRLERPFIKAIRVETGQSCRDALLQMQPWLAQMSLDSLLLIEGRLQGRYGGTGHTMDWDLAAQLAQGQDFLLAGGLTADNVAEAVLKVRPWGVDVSSGVEIGGVKDPAKIRAFIARAKQ